MVASRGPYRFCRAAAIRRSTFFKGQAFAGGGAGPGALAGAELSHFEGLAWWLGPCRYSSHARSRIRLTVPLWVGYRWRIGETEGRERRWSGNRWRSHHVAPTAPTSPTCARTDRPHRSRRLSQRQPLSHPARHAWDDLRGWPLRRPLSQAGSAGLSTLAAGPDHADAVPRGLERSTGR